MVHLTLAGVTEDGRQLRARRATPGWSSPSTSTPGSGPPWRRVATPATRHGSASWRGRWTATLRPRDIQARIRAGETPESVAAGRRHDRRQGHAVRRTRARRARARRPARPAGLDPPPPAESGRRGARTLGDAISSHLRGRNVDPDTVVVGRLAPRGRPLDADRVLHHRRPRRRRPAHLRPARQLRGRSTTTTPTGWSARWPTRRRAGADDDRARRRPVDGPPAPAVRRTSRASCRSATTPSSSSTRTPPARSRRRPTDAAALGARGPARGLPRLEPASTSPPTTEHRLPTRRERVDEAADGGRLRRVRRRPPRHEPPSRKPVKKTRGRASVPSWDEIMFGGGSRTELASEPLSTHR